MSLSLVTELKCAKATEQRSLDFTLLAPGPERGTLGPCL